MAMAIGEPEVESQRGRAAAAEVVREEEVAFGAVDRDRAGGRAVPARGGVLVELAIEGSAARNCGALPCEIEERLPGDRLAREIGARQVVLVIWDRAADDRDVRIVFLCALGERVVRRD